MKDYASALQAAQQLAASMLPEPELLAPQTPQDFVAYIEAEAARIGETLGGLSESDLEEAGGLDAWRELVIRAVAERAATAEDEGEAFEPVTRAQLLAQLSRLVGDDGTGDLGVIVDHATPGQTAEDLAEVVREARADAALERELG